VYYRLARRTWFTGAVNYDIIENVSDVTQPSNSTLPHVLSDIAEYKREGPFKLTRFLLNQLYFPAERVYARASAGIYEEMFGGAGGQVLYLPRGARWGIDLAVDWVKQRDYEQLFTFRDYDIVTGHASVYWDTGWYGVGAQVDAGRYLAGDWGATLTMKRRFANGWEVGGFFTLTDVPFDEFGEGSFDKGLFLTIPFNWFLPYESRSEFSTLIRPLSRDGGQRLNISNRLYPMVEDMDRAGLRDNWEGFWE